MKRGETMAMDRVVKALLAGLLSWLLLAAIGAAVALFFLLWPASVILGALIFLEAPLLAMIVALIVLFWDSEGRKGKCKR